MSSTSASRLLEANAQVKAAIDATIATGHEIGVQVAAYVDGQLALNTWSGLADAGTKRPVDEHTLFNVFSVTKAVAATAIHIQVDRGLLDYEANVSHYWPEYAQNGKGRTTLRHVLTHRAGIPQMPIGATPQRMCDWTWMTTQIAALAPIAEPGTKTLYLSMTFGWILGEIVRRVDPQHRSFGRFVQDEIARPLGLSDLWIGIPDEVEPRIARLVDATPPVPVEYLPPLYTASMPSAVDLVPRVFELPNVRRADIGGVGGIFNARSCAGFWSLLAQGGKFNGVRLLSKELVASLNRPRANSEETDPVMFGFPLPISTGGYWLGGAFPPVATAISPTAIFHPGAGNSVGWADFDKKLAVAICHNRMFNSQSAEQDSVLAIARVVNRALGFA